MTEQEQKAFTAMREALERIAGTEMFAFQCRDIANSALTAANAVSHPKPETTTSPEGRAITSESAANAVSHPQATEPAWRPIESAPHSANPVLALSESGSMKIETGYWLVNMLHASKVDGENCNYTHWIPLPAAPEAHHGK